MSEIDDKKSQNIEHIDINLGFKGSVPKVFAFPEVLPDNLII